MLCYCLLTYLLLKTTDLEITVILYCNKTRMFFRKQLKKKLFQFFGKKNPKKLNSIDYMITERAI